MEKRFFLFILVASAVLLGNALLMNWLNPPPPPKPKPPKPPVVAKEEGPDPKPAEVAAPEEAPPAAQAQAEPAAAEPQAQREPQWITLGSVNPDDPFRMGVTITSRGAAVERIELSSQQLRDTEAEGGYLGNLATETAPGRSGAIVHAVVKGTPADKAGLQVGDIITAFNGAVIKGELDLLAALRKTEPGQQVSFTIQRGDANETPLTATLGHAPLEVVRPERDDPRSLLLTLERLGDLEISRDIGLETREDATGVQITAIAEESPAAKASLRIGDVVTHIDERTIARPTDLTEVLSTIPKGTRLMVSILRDGQILRLPLAMPSEIAGLNLRGGVWEVLNHDGSQAAFRWPLPHVGLEILKHYRLAKVETSGKDYHLVVDVEIRNTGDQARKVAYQLDGPTGLPIEGWWYASKISRTWSGVGVRDVAVYFRGDAPELIAATSLLGDKEIRTMPEKSPLVYAAIDAQYIAAALLPQRPANDELWFAEVQPLRVGMVPEDKNRRRLVNTSFRLVSQTHDLEPDGPPLKHQYLFFAGPKKPELLAHYELDELVYYGWFGFVARPMLGILHFFYSLVGNYGVAIIMLTVLVRGCMFPLSRKQAISAQKMQELQPEIKKLAEKYKNNMEQRNKAQQELFRKHNFNPLGGCWLMFLQLPIFIGLYRSLMVDVELRQAPLIPGLRWCSNLAAPDMLFSWSSWMPQFLVDETGWLGPYFNLLPIITVGLFLWQQKMFMPPPTDEQAAMQQKMMKYMMVLMGFMFFKVASGLCIYFIASSLWGITERKLLPKTMTAKTATPEPPTAARASAAAGGNGATGRAPKKQRGGK